MDFHLSKNNSAIILIGSVALICLFIFGSGQYQLRRHHQDILQQNEKLVFHFTTIRDHITESLAEQKYQQLKNISSEIEQLNKNISSLLKNSLIPDEYKFSLASQVDLQGIALLLNSLASGDRDAPKVKQLLDSIRILGDRLMLFDRVMITHINKKLIGFQAIIIAVLMLLVIVLVNFTYLWQRRSHLSLLGLSQQLSDIASGKRTSLLVKTGNRTWAALVARLNSLLSSSRSDNDKLLALQTLFQNCILPVMLLDREGRVAMANPAACRLFEQAEKTKSDCDVASFLKLDGNRQEVENFVHAVQQQDQTAELEITVKGAAYQLNLHCNENIAAAGPYRLLTMTPAESSSLLETSKAVTASQLAAIGELAMDIAHEINDMSNSTINFSQLLLEEAETCEHLHDHKQLITNILTESERIATIVQHLLFFNGNTSRQTNLTYIDKAVEDTLILMQHQLKIDGIKVEVSLPHETPPVRINPLKLKYILLNLLSNARYALNNRDHNTSGAKKIAISGEILTETGTKKMLLSITDWGTGIKPGGLGKLFTPFYSTKPPGQGTGLGLSTSRALIQDSGGRIEIKSAQNDHTSVIIQLPLAEAA